eukprot:scaffold69538_cov14-Tisochrysis_lutea.AAC.1
MASIVTFVHSDEYNQPTSYPSKLLLLLPLPGHGRTYEPIFPSCCCCCCLGRRRSARHWAQVLALLPQTI